MAIKVDPYLKTGANTFQPMELKAYVKASTITAIGLAETASIDDVLVNLNTQIKNTKNKASWYAVCSTAASTAAKVATCTDFVLEAGTRVVVKFTNANTSSTMTLNINNTGNKNVYWYGTTSVQSYCFRGANQCLEFVYDGTNYMFVGGMSNMPTATTSSYGAVQLSTSVSNSTSTVPTSSVLYNLAQRVSTLENNSGGAKIAYGTYTGTGTYGQNNPCTLVFDKIPDVIFLTMHVSTYPNAIFLLKGAQDQFTNITYSYHMTAKTNTVNQYFAELNYTIVNQNRLQFYIGTIYPNTTGLNASQAPIILQFNFMVPYNYYMIYT